MNSTLDGPLPRLVCRYRLAARGVVRIISQEASLTSGLEEEIKGKRVVVPEC